MTIIETEIERKYGNPLGKKGQWGVTIQLDRKFQTCKVGVLESCCTILCWLLTIHKTVG